MTVKPESLFGRDIIKNIKGAFWQRVENRHGGGVPDLYGIKNKRPIWLELKCIKMNSVNISPLQISWNYNNFTNGGKNYYLIKHIERRTIKLYDGDKGADLSSSPVDRVPCLLDISPTVGVKYNYKALDDFLFK